jgi:hypothetical protein
LAEEIQHDILRRCHWQKESNTIFYAAAVGRRSPTRYFMLLPLAGETNIDFELKNHFQEG